LLKQKKIRTNKVNGKSYIGSSVDLGRRFSEYFRASQLKKDNKVINKALLKYGYSNFSFETLEHCDPSVVIQKEQYYIDLFKPEYNVSPTAGSTLGYRHSESIKAKIREKALANLATK
jgi:group I intron endonuclease